MYALSWMNAPIYIYIYIYVAFLFCFFPNNVGPTASAQTMLLGANQSIRLVGSGEARACNPWQTKYVGIPSAQFHADTTNHCNCDFPKCVLPEGLSTKTSRNFQNAKVFGCDRLYNGSNHLLMRIRCHKNKCNETRSRPVLKGPVAGK